MSKEAAAADWSRVVCVGSDRETEVAHDPKKHGVTMLYSSLGSGHPLVQRRLCSSKRADSIHNSRKLPRTDMNML